MLGTVICCLTYTLYSHKLNKTLHFMERISRKWMEASRRLLAGSSTRSILQWPGDEDQVKE